MHKLQLFGQILSLKSGVGLYFWLLSSFFKLKIFALLENLHSS